ncbi:TPA: hypothetical protein ACIAR9_004063 [Salmonella enterica subsp. enterica serovar Poona]
MSDVQTVVLNLGDIPNNLGQYFAVGAISPVAFFLLGMGIGLIYKSIWRV